MMPIFNLNKDIKTRDEIIFDEYDPQKYVGGIRHYKELTYEQLEELDDKCFLDPEECQNYSPSIAEFMDFMKDHREFTAHGYVVSDTRDDYRVSIEGLFKFGNITYEETIEFVDMFRCADEFTCTKEELYCWYD